MKKFYAFTLLLFGMAASLAQTVVYSENFGTPSGTTAIAAHTFQNPTPITYSGTADVRATQGSNVYSGASAGGNVFFTNTAGRFLLIEGINTSAYATADLNLSFGLRQEGTTPATPSSALLVEYSIDGILFLPLTYNRTVNNTWEMVTINSGIPSALNLRLRFTQTATTQYRVDDIRITALSATCLLSLGTETTSCNALTAGLDTYTITIPFTNGGTATYSIVTSHGVIGGDNPSTTSSGNIVITNVPENGNQDVTVTITGGTCNLMKEVQGVSCKPINTLPYNETFDYSAGNVLGFQQMWREINSGDSAIIIPGSLSYEGYTSTGNSVAFGGAGAESYTPFTPATNGSLYVSFLMNVTDMSNVTTDGTQTYIAGLTQEITSPTSVNYNNRLWLQKNGEQYRIGMSSGATTTNYTTTSFNVGDVVMVIMGFDYATNTYNAWINPNLSTFSTSTTPTLTETVTTAPANFGTFILRQEDATNTPAAITFDELRMATSLDALSTKSNEIAGFAMYPNPVTGGLLTITSANNTDKEVAIYDMLGKQVVNTTTVNNTVNVAGLTSGIYMVQITEEGKTATRKLVVR